MTRQIRRLAEAAGAAVVLSPGSTGVLPDAHPQNMHVGGSKGSISGNFAMANAELVIVIGSRAVCQADCSGIGYKSAKARHQHQRRSRRRAALQQHDRAGGRHRRRDRAACAHLTGASANKAEWLKACAGKESRMDAPTRRRGSTRRPRTIRSGSARCSTSRPRSRSWRISPRSIDAAKFFDAGDVQANGFQIVEDDRTGDTFTETGASYMGFAASALLASAHRRQAALRHRVLRRRLLHDESAGADRRGRAQAARHDRDLRQSPHGRDHRAAACAIWPGLPHQRYRAGRLCAAGRLGEGRACAAWRVQRGRIARGFETGPCA